MGLIQEAITRFKDELRADPYADLRRRAEAWQSSRMPFIQYNDAAYFAQVRSEIEALRSGGNGKAKLVNAVIEAKNRVVRSGGNVVSQMTMFG